MAHPFHLTTTHTDSTMPLLLLLLLLLLSVPSVVLHSPIAPACSLRSFSLVFFNVCVCECVCMCVDALVQVFALKLVCENTITIGLYRANAIVFDTCTIFSFFVCHFLLMASQRYVVRLLLLLLHLLSQTNGQEHILRERPK